MSEKILMLGINGRLAQRIKKIKPNTLGFDKTEVDVSNKAQIQTTIQQIVPSLIINCAALTDVDYCEQHPEECDKVNAEAVRYIIEAADVINAKVIHFSSNYAVNPINEYGKAKKKSEEMARNHLVIRTDTYDARTFINHTLLETGNDLAAYDDVYYNPIYAGTVAELIFKLRDHRGVLNIFTQDKVSFYEFALKICEVFNIDKLRVKPISQSPSQKGMAQRPKETFITPDIEISLNEDLERFKHDIKFKC